MYKLLAALWVLGILLAAPAHADSTANVRQTLQALYNQANAAVARKDAAAATAIDTRDFVLFDQYGAFHTVPEIRQRGQYLFNAVQSIEGTTRIDRVTLRGKNATVTARQHIVLRSVNPKTHHLLVDDQWSTMTDRWVRQGGSWRRTRSQVRESHSKRR